MRFDGSAEDSVGVEYELQLLDGESLDMVDAILPLIEAMGEHPNVEPEYNQSTVEIVSRVERDVHDLEGHVRERGRFIRKHAHEIGLEICGGGTHPFRTRLATVTPEERYREVEALSGLTGGIQLVCAMHVHIGVPSGREAIRLMRRTRRYLPLMLAASAASPFFMSHVSGFAAYRPRVLVAAHSYGTPPQLDSWEQFEAMWQAATRAGMYKSFKDPHWDLRPKPEFGTLEFRIMDAQHTVSETMALVALVHSLVRFVERYEDAAPLLPELPVWIEVENAYRAAHRGLESELMVDEAGHTAPTRQLVSDLLDWIEPAARQLGERDYLERVARNLEDGVGYQRQRAVYRETGSLKAVTSILARELAADLG